MAENLLNLEKLIERIIYEHMDTYEDMKSKNPYARETQDYAKKVCAIVELAKYRFGKDFMSLYYSRNKTREIKKEVKQDIPRYELNPSTEKINRVIIEVEPEG